MVKQIAPKLNRSAPKVNRSAPKVKQTPIIVDGQICLSFEEWEAVFALARLYFPRYVPTRKQIRNRNWLNFARRRPPIKPTTEFCDEIRRHIKSFLSRGIAHGSP